MPELHDLPDLVDPTDFELSPAQQRRVWLRNHAFALAFGVTLTLAAVLTVRVVTLEARHRAPEPTGETSAQASAQEARADSQAVMVATAASESRRDENRAEPSASAVDDRQLPLAPEAAATLPIAETPPAEARRATRSSTQPVRQSPPPNRPAVSRERTAPTTSSRSTPSRTRNASARTSQPERAVQADAVPPRAVEDKPPVTEAETGDADSGTLTVQVQPWGSVFINDRLVQREVSARYVTRLQAGSYPVKVVHPVLGTWRGVARVQRGKEVAVFVNFNK